MPIKDFRFTFMKPIVFEARSWPRAIIHIDGDAFFTSCEEAVHPELQGRPIVTGGERGIVACASYAAKERGVSRGVPLHKARLLCPDLVVLPSDYETYSLFSRRMFAILRRFTPQVEEYSIDEAFADITGLRRPLNGSYETISARIKETVSRELGLTVSLGLSLTKVLAKIASKHDKPDGLTVISGRNIPAFLRDLPLDAVWGIGHATANYLHKEGLRTALDFARLPEERVLIRYSKPLRELWAELRGASLYPVKEEDKSRYASISKTKTFAPPRRDRDYIFAQLFRNLESACIKARRHNLVPRRFEFFLKTQDFRFSGTGAHLNRPSSHPLEYGDLIRQLFDAVYEPDRFYRATGVMLLDLIPDSVVQYNLFEDPLKVTRVEYLYQAVDQIARKYGKHTVHLGSSHPIEQQGSGKRGNPTARSQTRITGETDRQRLGLVLLHLKNAHDREGSEKI